MSPQRHTLAVLRAVCGLSQKEMAGILECSTPTIQAIELGKLQLSEKLAGLVSLKTGIDLAWLLIDDVTQPPVDLAGEPFTREKFRDYQEVALLRRNSAYASMEALHCLESNIKRLCAITLRGYKVGTVPLCAYKIAKAFDELETQFSVCLADHEDVKITYPENFEEELKENPRLFFGIFLDGYFNAVKREAARKRTKDHPTENLEISGGDAFFTKDGQIQLTPLRPKGHGSQGATSKATKK